MVLKILIIDKDESVSGMPDLIYGAARLFELKGHEVNAVLTVSNKDDLSRSLEFLKTGADAICVAGDTEQLRAVFKDKYSISGTLKVFEIEGTIFILDDRLTEKFILETAIPALNSKSKTLYTSAILKTFGISADGLKKRLGECVRNKYRIAFRFVELSGGECEVRIRYSNNTSSYDEIVKRAIELCGEYLYSVKGETLPEAVINLLKQNKKKLCIAESFTGGALTASLIAIPGASEVIKEGIVSYSNEAKQKRLNIDPKLIDLYGAVSVETVYEMAANLLISNPDCDFALSTSGNAGPTAEKDGQKGLFFIGVGNRKRVHIYDGLASGTRGDVISAGVNSALYNLYKKLKDKEFLISGTNNAT